VIGYFHPAALQYSSSSSSLVTATFTTFLNPLTRDPAIDDVTSELMTFGSKTHGWVRFARSASFGHVSVSEGGGRDRTHRTTKGTQLPVEDTDDTILCRVEDQVVHFIVSVNDSGTGLRLVGEVLGVPLHKLVESGDLSDGFVGLNIHRRRLCERNPRQGFYLAREIGVRRTKVLETELIGRKRRQSAKCTDCGKPADFCSVPRLTEKKRGSPLPPVFRLQLGHVNVGEYPSV
jgi:hypothetical protein